MGELTATPVEKASLSAQRELFPGEEIMDNDGANWLAHAIEARKEGANCKR